MIQKGYKNVYLFSSNLKMSKRRTAISIEEKYKIIIELKKKQQPNNRLQMKQGFLCQQLLDGLQEKEKK